MQIPVILNSEAGQIAKEGDAAIAEKIKSGFHSVNLDVSLHKINGQDLEPQIQSLMRQQPEVIVAAGGDGTISSIANYITDTSIALGIIPLGTMNHFAKDLGIPLDISSAIRAIQEKNSHRVDVGTVNGRTFINNCSIGMYPQAVRERENFRQEFGSGKIIAMGIATAGIFQRFPLFKVVVKIDDTIDWYKIPFLFVGNNTYETNLLNLGQRKSLNNGILSLYHPNTSQKFSLFRFASLAMIDRLRQVKDFRITHAEQFELQFEHQDIDVALDGEIVQLHSPLRYEIQSEALKTILPEDT
ncbi:MAG: hypothetical protein GF372_06180 [Candidatus Marinimicrobia bacterium]|nr:hypothetical protein [Candidatus Neomarinimicrobiota bacterium]